MFALLDWLSRRVAPVTVRSMSAEFGPPPAVRYPELALYSDAELYRRDRDDILAEIRALRAARRRAPAA
jgi:hypothetical protein